MLLLTLALIALVASIQLGFQARQWLYSAADVTAWWSELDMPEREEKLRRDQNADFERWRRHINWAVATYNGGVPRPADRCRHKFDRRPLDLVRGSRLSCRGRADVFAHSAFSEDQEPVAHCVRLLLPGAAGAKVARLRECAFDKSDALGPAVGTQAGSRSSHESVPSGGRCRGPGHRRHPAPGSDSRPTAMGRN